MRRNLTIAPREQTYYLGETSEYPEACSPRSREPISRPLITIGC